MHSEVLKKEQVEILSLLKLFNKDFYLVGGTAIALHIGHRYSIDFDLFTFKDIKRTSIKHVLEKNNYTLQHILFEDAIQVHCIINQVKITFYQYPYKIVPKIDFNGYIKLPDLLSLASMKAFALGGRGKWKDYVDLYFILKDHFTLNQVVDNSKSIFKDSFNDKLFRQQLTYYKDISFAEEVEYLSNPVSENEIKEFLTEIALTPF